MSGTGRYYVKRSLADGASDSRTPRTVFYIRDRWYNCRDVARFSAGRGTLVHVARRRAERVAAELEAEHLADLYQ